LIVQTEGALQITGLVEHYSLSAILPVDYHVFIPTAVLPPGNGLVLGFRDCSSRDSQWTTSDSRRAGRSATTTSTSCSSTSCANRSTRSTSRRRSRRRCRSGHSLASAISGRDPDLSDVLGMPDSILLLSGLCHIFSCCLW
jgi:hypothetical protein